MEENTKKQVFHYIQAQSKLVSPHELSRETGKSRVSIHKALKQLVMDGDIEKHGISPRVSYSLKGFAVRVPIELTTDNIAHIIKPILDKYPVNYAGILGSVVRSESGKLLNMMISFRETFPILKLSALERTLSETLNVKIDLITDQGANKYIKSSMLSGLTIVYGTISSTIGQ